MKHTLDIGTSNNDWEKLYLDLLKEYKALQDKYNHENGKNYTYGNFPHKEMFE